MEPAFNRSISGATFSVKENVKPSALRELIVLAQKSLAEGDISKVAIDLRDRAYNEISLWDRFIDLFASCFGFETTAQKIESAFKKIVQNQEEKDKSSKKENPKEETPSRDEQKAEHEKAAIEQERLAKEQRETEERIKKEAEIERLRIELEAREKELNKSRELNERNAMLAEDGKSQAVFKKQDIAKQLEIDRLKKQEAERKEKENLKFAADLFINYNDQILFDVGFDQASIKETISKIEDQLKGLDPDKLKACIIHLASLNHYDIALHFAHILVSKYAIVSKDFVEDSDRIIASARDKIKWSFDQAENHIKNIRYMDLKKQLMGEYEARLVEVNNQRKKRALEAEAFSGRESLRTGEEFDAKITADFLLEKERNDDLNFYLNQIDSRLLDKIYSHLAMKNYSLAKARKFADLRGVERKLTYDFNGLYTYDESLDFMKQLKGTEAFFKHLDAHEFDQAYDCAAGISIGNKIDGGVFSEFFQKFRIIINHQAAHYFIKNRKWNLAKQYIDSLKFKDVQKPYLEEFEKGSIEDTQKVIAKLMAMLSTNTLCSIGNYQDRIDQAITVINNEMQNLDESGKEACYKFLTTLDHYKIAYHYAALCKAQIDSISDKVNYIRVKIRAANYAEAEKSIEAIKYFDVKQTLNAELERKKFRDGVGV